MKSFIAEIREKGVILEVVNGDLRYKAPKGAMNAETLSMLKQHKAEIINLLSTKPATNLVKSCQACRACAHWRGSYQCFASALFDGKPGAPGAISPGPCERWTPRDWPDKPKVSEMDADK